MFIKYANIIRRLNDISDIMDMYNNQFSSQTGYDARYGFDNRFLKTYLKTTDPRMDLAQFELSLALEASMASPKDQGLYDRIYANSVNLMSDISDQIHMRY